MSMNPEAHFDCLQITKALDSPLGGVARLDLQRIAFLSCLLSIYIGQPVSDWGYKFANTGSGLPFSDQLVRASEVLIASGAIVEQEGRIKITAHGTQLLEQLSVLQMLAPRRPCLDAAAASLLAVPGSVMAEGLQQEPTIAASRLHDSASLLLDSPHIQTLHEHFAALANVFPPGTTDLLSPSVLWLTYMAHVNAERSGNHGNDEGGPGRGGAPDGGPPPADRPSLGAHEEPEVSAGVALDTVGLGTAPPLSDAASSALRDVQISTTEARA